jgi:hypothetical protein
MSYSTLKGRVEPCFPLRHAVFLSYSSTMKMEMLCSSKISADLQRTMRQFSIKQLHMCLQDCFLEVSMYQRILQPAVILTEPDTEVQKIEEPINRK